ncbi:MAG: SDR family NAD(P)-dependent oxidoreductase [Xanthobacteraceae bacterium]|jgi:NAD(P)-dependent dehydrogenase (short-subunit alcohol dehydrogenase family)
MAGEFSNKVAVVTGGSRGIGREIAVELARSGAQTVIVSSSADNLASAAKTITSAGLAPLTITADLRTLEGCQQAFDSVRDNRCDGTCRVGHRPAPVPLRATVRRLVGTDATSEVEWW